MGWHIVIAPRANKDAKKVHKSGLKDVVEKMLREIALDPYSPSYNFKKLVGDLEGCYSKRISYQHRLVYEINESTKEVRVLRMWSHYE